MARLTLPALRRVTAVMYALAVLSVSAVHAQSTASPSLQQQDSALHGRADAYARSPAVGARFYTLTDSSGGARGCGLGPDSARTPRLCAPRLRDDVNAHRGHILAGMAIGAVVGYVASYSLYKATCHETGEGVGCAYGANILGVLGGVAGLLIGGLIGSLANSELNGNDVSRVSIAPPSMRVPGVAVSMAFR